MHWRLDACAEARGQRANFDSNAYRIANRHPYPENRAADGDAAPDRYPVVPAHAHVHAQADVHRHAHYHAHGNVHAYADAYRHAYSNSDADRHPSPDSDGD
ncbi:MAG: hypothetical protein U9R15_14065 [Chloroflexota bacterium]|nr:hypothetical protein [Chloroflexota bacterium]